MKWILFVALVSGVVSLAGRASAGERQVTFSAKNHCLDNNDNFSQDGRFLCYDTRETIGPGIDNGQTIEMVEIATGAETLLYRPSKSVTGDRPAPGVAAASFSPVENKVAFIHGPPVDEVPWRGPYAKPNRCGMEVDADGSGRWTWLDKRDIETSRDTIPGAHRGGTHRHEYSLDGKRIGFTYDDFLLTRYDRTVGYMEKSPKTPEGASHYFAILVSVVPKETARPGEIEKAYGDSWVGAHGLMRAFIGKVRNPDGVTYEESLFVVDVPADVDITTADSGSATRFPSPPKGVRVRRLTHTWAGGTIRGSVDGQRIAYYGHAPDGSTQLFVISSNGSDEDPDPKKHPVQVTHLAKNAGPGLRWHPGGEWVFCTSNNAVVATRVTGEGFGKSVLLTPDDDTPRIDLVVSLDGKTLAYTKQVPTLGADGKPAKTYTGADFSQIFVLDIADALKGVQ
jgi:hypothetical protein